MNINLGNATAAGEFKVVLKNKDGEVTKETPWNDNLLLDRFFTMTSPGNYCLVGTGSTPPTNSDTKLSSALAGLALRNQTTSSGSDSVSGDEVTGYIYTTNTKIWRWDLGEVVGNISEFGLTASSGISTYILHVRSLIKDTNGNPTTITVTASDQLEIWWRLKKKFVGSAGMASGETTQNFTLNGVATEVKTSMINPARASAVGFFESNAIPVVLYNGYNGASTAFYVNQAIAAVDAVVATAAGSNVNYTSTTITAEQSAGFGAPVLTPIANGCKVTLTATFPLNSSASDTLPVKFLGIASFYTSSISSGSMIVKVTFNPAFIKGKDKVLTVSFSYTVTRA